MMVNIRKQLSALLDRLVNVSLQLLVLIVNAIEVLFYEPCYTEVMKFYTEPDTIGWLGKTINAKSNEQQVG
jgi:hypothetical protein